jgi:hypothetical protein
MCYLWGVYVLYSRLGKFQKNEILFSHKSEYRHCQKKVTYTGKATLDNAVPNVMKTYLVRNSDLYLRIISYKGNLTYKLMRISEVIEKIFTFIYGARQRPLCKHLYY